MLYEKNKKMFDDALFYKPSAEYRAAPFWAWNTKLNWEDMNEQIDVFKEMGMGGFHIHSRIGLDTPYMSEEFLNYIKKCNKKAEKMEMLTWLYDEDKWPSGFGGGYVTKNHDFRSRCLLFSPFFHKNGYYERKIPQENRLGIDGMLTLLEKYQVILKDGYLHYYRKLDENDTCQDNIWYAYRIVSKDLPWFNNQSYVDTLNKEAIEKFVEVTYEKYYKSLGNEFSRTIPAIFTDEPQFVMKQNLIDADSKQEIGIPYTDDIEESFRDKFDHSLMESLPEIFWELEHDQVSQIRYWYHEHITERFAKAYADTLGGWCKQHDIMLTGHMMEEPTLESQTRALGEAMRAYRSFQLPGIDILANRYEYSTAKQAQSSSRQYGRSGVMSELYGVTNWDFDFRGYKLQGDWQAAMGVSVRVPHLSWMRMNGEAKRDYPAPIDAHSPWYKKYHLIEDHFSRVNVCMTRGIPDVHIGVIHPIESYWICWGPDSQTRQKRNRLQENFDSIINWLLFSNLDFDFIAESSIQELYKGSKEKLTQIGEMKYEVIVVPDLITIRQSTIEMLKKHKENGGKIIFMGHTPQIIDGDCNCKFKDLFFRDNIIGHAKYELLYELDSYRQVDIINKNGSRNENFIHQLREEDECKWLFVAQGKPVDSLKLPSETHCTIIVKGNYEVWTYDTMTGTKQQVSTVFKNGKTYIDRAVHDHDSMLFRLFKKDMVNSAIDEARELMPARYSKKYSFIKHLNQPCKYKLSEKNVLLLDMARYQIDDSEIYEKEELLRVDNEVRKHAGYQLRTDSFPQPWLSPEESTGEYVLKCFFDIESEIDMEGAELAYEGKDVIVEWNQEIMTEKSDTFFVDKCFRVIKLSAIRKGMNQLVLKIPFGRKTDVEWCYILGDFGVNVTGDKCLITKPAKMLYFGDITRQGLSFYSGNISYTLSVEVPKGELIIEIPQYKGALVEIKVNGDTKGNIMLSPYRLNCGHVQAGKFAVELTLYGNRFAMFGQLHNCNRFEQYYGPKTWRTVENSWSYEYQMRETGILTAPIIYISEG